MFLGALMAIGLVFCYFTMLLDPLSKEEDIANGTIVEKTKQVEAANTIAKKEKGLKPQADAAEATLNQVYTLIPDGSPVAWFPPQATEFFKRQGIEKCAIHRGEEGADRELSGFKDLAWGLDISHVEVAPLASAIAAFENEHPLMEINTLQIESGRDNVQFQTARISINTVIRQ
jgi:hypothetical protein